MHTFIQSLAWRYATKKFDATKKISEEDMETLQESLRLSPSSFGLQPWKFVVIRDGALREKLREHSWGQSQITDASAIVVLCVRTDIHEAYVQKYVQYAAETQGIPVAALEEYKNMMIGSIMKLTHEERLAWAKKQVYIALGVLLSAAATMKIDACPMEGFDVAKYDEALGLPALNLSAAVVCALGYRAEDDSAAMRKKVRFPAEEIIVHR